MPKQLFLFLTCCFICTGMMGGNNVSLNTSYAMHFEEAYQTYPGIPVGLLEAVAWTQTRIRHIEAQNEPPSCTGMPALNGVMGLVGHHAHFRNNLTLVSNLSGKTAEMIQQSPRENILAYAAAFSQLLKTQSKTASIAVRSRPVLEILSEISKTSQEVNNFALNSQLYSILNFLNQADKQTAFHFPAYQINLETVFGVENYRILSATKVSIQGNRVHANGFEYAAQSTASADYAPALWVACPTCNYSSRSGTAISAVTLHTIQGSYSGAISWFQNCSSNVSSHYVTRSSDGQVTQMVLESDKAWHVGSENPYTIGIEHEGFVDDASWYTNELYQSTADLVLDICNSGYGIDPLKTWFGAPSATTQLLSANCYKIKGHQHFANQSHTDPGINWDWERFYRLLNGTPPTTNLTACSGTFYDGGGAASNYNNQERNAWLIAPSGASSVTLNFSSFDLETGYDYLYIYDGVDDTGEFIGRFDGTAAPGPFTANSGKFYLELRTDCGVTQAGWAANWTCSTGPLACGFPDGLAMANLNAFGVELSWNPVASATSYEVRYKHSLEGIWNSLAVTGSSQVLTGLKASSQYYWQVRALCGTGASTWAGEQFSTPQAANTTVNECSGTFRDSGGDLGEYSNYEDYTYTISLTGASTISMNFTSFDLENGFDHLYIYDGSSTSANQIGQYTGSNSPGTVTSSGSSLTFRFVSDSWTRAEGWEATWSCTSNLAPTIAIAPLNDWQTVNFNANFTDTDNASAGIDYRFYHVRDYNAIWACNRGNGFVYQHFTDSFPEWTTGAGNAYILNNRLHQTDTTTTNTNAFLDMSQDGNQAYLYNFKGRLWSGQSNRRFGMHIFSDAPSSPNRGNSYLIWLRGDNQTVEIYETINDVLFNRVSQPITIGDFVEYDFRILYDPQTGLLEVYQDNQLIANWIDPSPLTSGSHISLRSNQAHVDFDEVLVFKERGATATILVGPASSNDCRYQSPNPITDAGQVHSIIQDGNNNWSNTDFKIFKVDWTAPSDPTVSDGLSTDIDTSYSLSSLSANWTLSSDPNSDVQDYEYAIGSSSGSTDVRNWTSNGNSLNVTATGLALNHNQEYFLSVRALNGAGLYSNAMSSDGQLVWSPGTALVAGSFAELRVYPNPAKEKLWVELGERADFKLQLWDVHGQEVLRKSVVDGDRVELALAGLSSGLYILRLDLAGHGSFTKKIIID